MDSFKICPENISLHCQELGQWVRTVLLLTILVAGHAKNAESLHPVLQKYQPLWKYCTNIQAVGVLTDCRKWFKSCSQNLRQKPLWQLLRLRTSWFGYISLDYLIRKNTVDNEDLKQLYNQANFTLVLSEDVAMGLCALCTFPKWWNQRTEELKLKIQAVHFI